MPYFEKLEDLIFTLGRVHDKLKVTERIPMDYGSGELLRYAEVHALTYIGNHPDTNITNLAKIIGVTKGAVSQLVKKLERKKLVERYKDPGNNKEVLLRLTRKGEIDYHGHALYHAKADREFLEELEQLTPEQFLFLKEIFTSFERHIDKYIKNVKG